MGPAAMPAPSGVPARSLCRVHWRLGQALLPEHLARQEDAAARGLALRFAQLGPAPWGVAQVAWDDEALARGVVRLTQLLAILPRGRLVHLPGGARAEPLDLSSAAADQISVHLHLLDEQAYERDDAQASDLEALELAVDQLELSLSAGLPRSVDAIELLRLERGPDGAWAPSARYVPPLLALSAWPGYLAGLAGRLRRILAAWEDMLLADLDSHVLSTAKGLRAQECLRRGRLCAWFLAQLDPAAPGAPGAPIDLHPFELYRRVVELYLDVHGYQSPAAEAPPLAARTYDHADLAGTLEPLLQDLERRARLPHGRAPYAPFQRAGRTFAVALPADAAAQKLYWLVRRPEGVPREALQGVTLVAPGRLEAVHRHALRGVPVRALAAVPFRHDFDPDVEFHEILTEGEEWVHALREGRLAYVAEGPVARCASYLFWRGA